MKKGYINELTDDEKMSASSFKATITYTDGSVEENEFVQYSFADAFDVIKESHEDENNRAAKSILIELLK